MYILFFNEIKVITKLPNSEQSYKGKVKTHNYINRQNQSTTISIVLLQTYKILILIVKGYNLVGKTIRK